MPTNQTTDSLMRMKGQIETAKIDEAKIRGRLEKLKEQLNSDFDCQRTEQAKELSTQIEKKVLEKDRQLIAGKEKLEQQYEWN